MYENKADLLASLPPEWPEDLLPSIRSRVLESGHKIVVLDDDPTGTQTVYDVPVLTGWSQPALESVLAEPEALVYILTNSRSLPLAGAEARNRDIAANLVRAGRATVREFVVVSRSDSTLRGHYPGEVHALTAALRRPFDATLIVPFFAEGGRLTIHDTHYVVEGDTLVPAAETEFARDATFGYHHSDLRAWVGEKHHGRLSPQDVLSITIADLRIGGPHTVARKLESLHNQQVCIVNSATYRDLEVLVAGLLTAESAGKRFLYRTAASFVRVRAGLPPRGLLAAADLPLPATQKGGLVVVGSYVQKSTAQAAAAGALPGIHTFELRVDRLLSPATRDGEVERVVRQAAAAISARQDALVYTSRQLVTGAGREDSLRIGNVVSLALVDVVRRLPVRPAWVIAKGGITSSDVATHALGIQRAHVLGQALPGVPVWHTGQESRWPRLVYVVFPGNVGGPDALADLIDILRQVQVRRTFCSRCVALC